MPGHGERDPPGRPDLCGEIRRWWVAGPPCRCTCAVVWLSRRPRSPAAAPRLARRAACSTTMPSCLSPAPASTRQPPVLQVVSEQRGDASARHRDRLPAVEMNLHGAVALHRPSSPCPLPLSPAPPAAAAHAAATAARAARPQAARQHAQCPDRHRALASVAPHAPPRGGCVDRGATPRRDRPRIFRGHDRAPDAGTRFLSPTVAGTRAHLRHARGRRTAAGIRL